MRRFIKSLLAKNISRTLIVSTILMTAPLTMAKPAGAQVGATQRNWAVVEFVNKSNYGGSATAAVATDAITRELTKAQRYNLTSKTQVDAAMKEEGFEPPLYKLNFIKLGQSLGVDAIVTGAVEKVIISKNPTRAKVVMSVYVYDAHSGRAISGAAPVEGLSTGRVGMTGGEDVLVQEAIQLGALEAISRINSLQLKDATVTYAGADRILINKGTRDGFKGGMEVLILRHGDYVATVKLSEVSADDAQGSVMDSTKGVQPGDKARAIFPVESFTIKKDGTARVGKPKSSNVSSVLVTVLVLGLVVALLGHVGGSNTPVEDLTTESMADAANPMAVKVSWHANLFAKNPNNRIEWHIWRSDRLDQPVGVVPGTENFFIDDANALAGQWRDMGGLSGPPTCNDDPGTTDLTEQALSAGVTYNYSLSLVYKISSVDMPGGGGDEVKDCFFESARVNARGYATALNRPLLETPSNNSESVNLKTVKFTWDAVVGANSYAVQLSTDLTFSSNVRTVATINTAQIGGLISTDILDLRGLFPSGTKLMFWRVGARNLGDSPGPVADRFGNRYVFSAPFQFTPVDEPPPPPGN